MNELASLGIILLFALMAGHLAKFCRVPEVTGYILAGACVGPYVLGWITPENLKTLEVFSEVALGLILFSIGSAFEFSRFRQFGSRSLRIVGVEATLTAICVTSGMLAAGQRWEVAILLGAVSMETAAATTLMVIREANASGEMTELLIGNIALDNVACLFVFNSALTFLDLQRNVGKQPWLTVVHESLFPLVWQIVGAVALGFLIGLLLATWASRVVEHGEMLILLAGSVLFCVGLSTFFGVSPLVASLAVGATMVNLSGRGKDLFQALSRTDPPLYAIFFVIAGANLNLGLLKSLGLVGGIFVVIRLATKLGGTSVAVRRIEAGPSARKYLGFAMLAQAGLAIGLVLITEQRFPDLAPALTAIVLSAVAVFEILGPLCTRFALARSGESQPEAVAPVGLID